jgi:hypothetical protein
MTSGMKPVWQVVVLAVWINLAETVRWMAYTKPRFDALYHSRGLELPSGPVNNILWLIWGAAIAYIVYMLARKFTLLQTTLLTWLGAFVLVWIALWNSAVLPPEILPVVAPLSLVTVFVAALIARRLQPQPSA